MYNRLTMIMPKLLSGFLSVKSKKMSVLLISRNLHDRF